MKDNNPKVVIKVLYIEMPEDLHREIKAQALWRNITTRKYVLEAIIDRMKRDEKYQ
jgi:hypothetical protein